MSNFNNFLCVALISPAMLLVGCATNDSKELPLVHISVPYDKSAAANALARGRSVVDGVACVYHGSQYFLAPNVAVYLYPATPFFNELFAMQAKGNRTDEPEAVHSTRLVTKTDGRGRFRFVEMLPGRYHLYMYMSFNQAAERDVYAGYSDTGYGVVDHYQRQQYIIPRTDNVYGDVEVKTDGSIVKTQLLGGNTGILNRLSGC